MGKRAKGWEDKFVKLKDVYQKLRDEHIKLLRQKAEVDKKLSTANVSLEQSNKIQCELQDSLELSKTSLKDIENELITLKAAEAAKIQLLGDEKIELLESNNQLNVILPFLFVEQNHSQTSHSIIRYFSHFFIRH
jgi:huntingtin interacting protein 1